MYSYRRRVQETKARAESIAAPPAVIVYGWEALPAECNVTAETLSIIYNYRKQSIRKKQKRRGEGVYFRLRKAILKDQIPIAELLFFLFLFLFKKSFVARNNLKREEGLSYFLVHVLFKACTYWDKKFIDLVGINA